jgi:hypothetical protein
LLNVRGAVYFLTQHSWMSPPIVQVRAPIEDGTLQPTRRIVLSKLVLDKLVTISGPTRLGKLSAALDFATLTKCNGLGSQKFKSEWKKITIELSGTELLS